MDVLLVHFHGQMDLPDEFAGGALTAMEGFRLYLPGDPPFLTTDAQGITHDAQFQGGGIHAGCQRFQVYRVFIFVKIRERVLSGGSPWEKCRAERRRNTGA
jgi:hypothetical protein